MDCTSSSIEQERRLPPACEVLVKQTLDLTTCALSHGRDGEFTWEERHSNRTIKRDGMRTALRVPCLSSIRGRLRQNTHVLCCVVVVLVSHYRLQIMRDYTALCLAVRMRCVRLQVLPHRTWVSSCRMWITDALLLHADTIGDYVDNIMCVRKYEQKTAILVRQKKNPRARIHTHTHTGMMAFLYTRAHTHWIVLKGLRERAVLMLAFGCVGAAAEQMVHEIREKKGISEVFHSFRVARSRSCSIVMTKVVDLIRYLEKGVLFVWNIPVQYQDTSTENAPWNIDPHRWFRKLSMNVFGLWDVR